MYQKVDPGWELIIAEYLDARSRYSAAKADKDRLEEIIKDRMGAFELLVDEEENPVLTFKQSKDRVVFETQEFATAHPDLYEKFTAVAPGSRRLILKLKS